MLGIPYWNYKLHIITSKDVWQHEKYLKRHVTMPKVSKNTPKYQKSQWRGTSHSKWPKKIIIMQNWVRHQKWGHYNSTPPKIACPQIMPMQSNHRWNRWWFRVPNQYRIRPILPTLHHSNREIIIPKLNSLRYDSKRNPWCRRRRISH